MFFYQRMTLAAIVLAAIPLAAEADNIDLDVTRVALFSSGVGYFECDAAVDGNSSAELKFRTEQINDILKSMIVQDFDGGTIGAISYASQDPIEKTLRSFGVDLTGKPTLGQLLDQLRGEPVEIAGGREMSGVILGIEKKNVLGPDGKTLEQRELLTLLTESGLQQIDLATVHGLRLTNEKVDGELRKALATLAKAHDADKKSVVLNFEGDGRRRVRAAYLLEAPIWKTSYRLVLSDEKKPFIQGWATVENATEEDWNNVRLSLISGRPISFRMDLYTPLYVPRPLEQLELYASLRPPSYEGGFAAEEQKMAARGSVRRGGRAGAGGGQFGQGPSDRAFPQSYAFRLDAADKFGVAVAEEARLGLRIEDAGVQSVATATEAGELFAYHIDAPVSIPRQHSAMLPIVNQALDGEKISIFNIATHHKHPLNGLEIENTTGLNLMQGPVTVFDGDIYAGDAKLPDLKPDEKRLIAYALDLSTEVLIKQKPAPAELVSLRIIKGTLWRRHKYVDNREYQIKNKADKDRTVLVEQGYTEDWKLVTPKEPYERTQNLLRFKVEAAAGQTTPLAVSLERVADEAVVLSNVGLNQITLYLKASAITPAVKQALERVIELRTALDAAQRHCARLERQRKESIDEQARIRENLKTLDRSTDAYRRQLEQFDKVDARIAELGQQVRDARDGENDKRRELDNYLRTLSVE